ncbi:hypothetical protein BXZ70DRAFT_681739 [Cristinia sonorae]|uniref:RanBD1 domain-containing protein n=1 Tax=Cristinia sonorae TaxID=1940300 RepID=A0A8K0UTZ2_9AGAR|nr:hypothetical protein BXZ70DRAFT_681739 [Cristinia sonorae]
MFPLNDFNFVCCALATVSAAVGYKYTQRNRRQLQRGRSASWASESLKAARRYLPRRYSSVNGFSTFLDTDVDGYSSDAPTPSDTASDETEPGSLKRKHRDEIPNNSNDADESSWDSSLPPPLKRFRTATPELVERGEDQSFEDQIATPPPLTPEAAADVDLVKVEVTEADEMIQDYVAPVTPVARTLTIPVIEDSPAAAKSPTSPLKLASTFIIPACKPSSAFSAFTGASSGFSSSSASLSSQRPAWCVVETSKEAVTPNAALNVDDAPTANESQPLGTQAQVQPLTTPLVTGEEDEDVEAELKGVKLLIKRGNKDFTDGILGHVKFLSNKQTKDERIVFRREPVWKVSMSVRLRPIVRCTFDEEHGILRITLKEKPVDQDGAVVSQDIPEELVIYALRRGKVSRSDFADFAKGIVASTRLVADPSQEVISIL